MDKWYCAACGSLNVETRMWVNPNTKVFGKTEILTWDFDHNYCNDCKKPTALMTLEQLWDEFSIIPIDNEDCITEPFLNFERGTSRFEVWHWFDERCPNGVVKDLIGE